MRLLRRLTDGLAALGASDSVPYLAEYALPGTVAPAPHELRQFDGVKLWHVVTPTQGAHHLLAYWLSKNHFQRDGSGLAQRLTATLISHGLVGPIAVAPVAWWKRIKPWAAILTIAAVLGAMDAIGNHYDRLFAAPELAISTEPTRFEVLEGADVPMTVRVLNQLTTEHSDIALDGELTAPGAPPRRIVLRTSRIPQLVGGASKEVTAYVSAPKPGLYSLLVRADAAAGLLRAPKRFESTADFEVWPRAPTGSITLRTASGPNAFLLGTVTIGRPAQNGLDCQLDILHASGIGFAEMFDMDVEHSKPTWNVAGKGTESVAALAWSIAPVLEGKQKLAVDFILTRPGNTDWNSLVQNSKLACQNRREKFRNE